ncbi:MAG: hypothetical protein HFI67_10915 [Lachnospiraceae bacterium]|nr:hypothetical protein [Lachnospiraceae bacterium]
MRKTEKNRNSSFGMGVGATSILMVFVLLCLVVFAMLSLVNANADKKLNDRLANRTKTYYAACDKAETLLEDMDSRLEQLYLENPEAEAYLQACLSYLDGAGGVAVREEDGMGVRFSFSVIISDEQHLSVVAAVPKNPAQEGHYYRIKAWQTMARQAWEPDTKLPVMESEMPALLMPE